MSTALIDRTRFADIHASLIEHGTHGMDETSCPTTASGIARAIGVSHPFGKTGREAVIREVGRLVFDLARLNHAAYMDRYDEKGEPQPKPTKPDGRRMSLCGTLKALQCLRYNCDGGKVVNKSILAALETLNTLIEELKDRIIDEITDYQEAAWF